MCLQARNQAGFLDWWVFKCKKINKLQRFMSIIAQFPIEHLYLIIVINWHSSVNLGRTQWMFKGRFSLAWFYKSSFIKYKRLQCMFAIATFPTQPSKYTYRQFNWCVIPFLCFMIHIHIKIHFVFYSYMYQNVQEILNVSFHQKRINIFSL